MDFEVILIIFGIIAGVIMYLAWCLMFANIAENKGHSAGKAFCACFFLNIIGFIWVAGLPDIHLQYQLDQLEKKLHKFISTSGNAQTEDAGSKARAAEPVAWSGDLSRAIPVKTTPTDKWKCSCGKSNPPFVAKCSCGRSKSDTVAEKTSMSPETPGAEPVAVASTSPVADAIARVDASNTTLPPDGWRCACGKGNPPFVMTCTCGRNKKDL